MAGESMVLNKSRDGWAMVALLVVMAILALMMAYYLPAVLERYSPSETADEEGTRKPTTEYVRDQLAPIDQRNQEVDDFINQQTNPQEEQRQDEDYAE